MARLHSTFLQLERCPHCGVDSPSLSYKMDVSAADYLNRKRCWRVYQCLRCAGPVVASADAAEGEVKVFFPAGAESLSADIPDRARTYLQQAIDSVKSPAGAVMLAASAIDAMLKAKGLKEGSLHARIEKAVANNLLTSEMGAWAHEVRLDANDQRHSDDGAPIPTNTEADRTIEFAKALAQFLFVLPARVTRGIQSAKKV